MSKQMILLFALFVSGPVWSQVQPAATGGEQPVATGGEQPVPDDSRMVVPPLAGVALYPNVTGTDERSNYVLASITANAAYSDNIQPLQTSVPIADYYVSILPTLTLDKRTSRQKMILNYSPSFSFYKDTNGLNTMDHSATGAFESRLSPHLALSLQDSFIKTSNVFNTSFPFAAGGLTGSTQTPAPAVIAPYAEQIRNDANVDIAYQYSARSMIGAGGLFSDYRYPNKAQATGLYDSDGKGGSAFYDRRLSRSQYAGVLYEYNQISSYLNQSNSDTNIHSVLPFYALSAANKYSLSVAVGAQRVAVRNEQLPAETDWIPAAVLSFGWQGDRTYAAASFLHTVVAGQGLLGAFTSNNVNGSGGWRFARNWNAAASFSYQFTNTISSVIGSNYNDISRITGEVSVTRSIGERISIGAGYERLNEQYNGLAIVTANGDSDRTFVSVTYNQRKALGR